MGLSLITSGQLFVRAAGGFRQKMFFLLLLVVGTSFGGGLGAGGGCEPTLTKKNGAIFALSLSLRLTKKQSLAMSNKISKSAGYAMQSAYTTWENETPEREARERRSACIRNCEKQFPSLYLLRTRCMKRCVEQFPIAKRSGSAGTRPY